MPDTDIDLSAGIESAHSDVDLSAGLETEQPASSPNPANIDMSTVPGATPGTPSPQQVASGGLRNASQNRYVEPLNRVQAVTHDAGPPIRTRQEADEESNWTGAAFGGPMPIDPSIADKDPDTAKLIAGMNAQKQEHPVESLLRQQDPVLASAPVGAYEAGAGLKDVAVAAAHRDATAAARGGTRAISGAMEAGTIPFGTGIAQAPLRMGIGYLEGVAAGKSAEFAAKKMGLSPDAQEFWNTVGFFLPNAYHTVKANTRLINERDLSQHVPGAPEGTTAKGVQMGPAGAMVTETPAGQRVLRTKIGPLTKNVTLSEGNQLPPAAPTDPAVHMARDQAKAAVSAMADYYATDQAAKDAANGVQPPRPGEEGSGKAPMPAGMERGQVTPQTVENLAQAITLAPKDARGSMITDAHEQLA
jgi:hypothetical protein